MPNANPSPQPQASSSTLNEGLWRPLAQLRLAARSGDVDSGFQAIQALKARPKGAWQQEDHRTLIDACSNPSSTSVLLMALEAFNWRANVLLQDPAPLRRATQNRSHALTTPLMIALSSGCWESALALMERVKDPLLTGVSFLTPISRCAMGAAKRPEGAQAIISRLLELGASPTQTLKIGSWAGANALHISAELLSTATHLFTPLGIDLNAEDHAFNRPFDLALRAPNPWACQALLNAGVDPISYTGPFKISAMHILCDAIARSDPHQMIAMAPSFAPVFKALSAAGLSITGSLSTAFGSAEPISPRDALRGSPLNAQSAIFAERFEISMGLGSALPSRPSRSL